MSSEIAPNLFIHFQIKIGITVQVLALKKIIR